MTLDNHRWWLLPVWRVGVWLGRCLILGLWLLAATCVTLGMWYGADALVKVGSMFAMLLVMLQWATMCWWPWNRLVVCAYSLLSRR
jgi:hypothetical protein